MKLEDCKIGMLVIAHEKNIGQIPMKEFLEDHPLGVAYIMGVDEKREYIQIGHSGRFLFLFKPEDITEVK